MGCVEFCSLAAVEVGEATVSLAVEERGSAAASVNTSSLSVLILLSLSSLEDVSFCRFRRNRWNKPPFFFSLSFASPFGIGCVGVEEVDADEEGDEVEVGADGVLDEAAADAPKSKMARRMGTTTVADVIVRLRRDGPHLVAAATAIIVERRGGTKKMRNNGMPLRWAGLQPQACVVACRRWPPRAARPLCSLKNSSDEKSKDDRFKKSEAASKSKSKSKKIRKRHAIET